MRPVTILTPRLLLRPARPDDGPAFVEAAAENFGDPFFWHTHDLLEDDALAGYLNARRMAFDGKGELIFTIWRDGRLAGEAGLQPPDYDPMHWNIVYWTRRSLARQGIATEAANALARFAFSHLRARSIGLACVVGNEGSRRVIGKLGFKRHARESNHRLPDGRTVDAEIFHRTGIAGLPPLEVSWRFGGELSR